MLTRRLLPVLAALAFAGVSLAGCAVQTFPRPKFAAQASSALAKVSHEPPPARVETTPPRPATPPGTVWVDGEWSWKRRRWAWTPGRWVLPPAGATYSPWVTVRAPDGTLYFAPAVWHDAAGKPLAAPKPIAQAAVESGAVVDAEGDMERTTVLDEE